MTRRDELEQLILHHKDLYYRGQAEISDAAFDELEDELRSIAPDSPILAVVGHTVTDEKVRHARPMMSLDKRRKIEEIVDWMADEPCFVTDKMDGSSCSLVYDHGVLRIGKTRGDGTFGENLTVHLRHVDIPRRLHHQDLRRQTDVEIRGELCISRDAFFRLSDEMAARELEKPKSIRNIVAGLLHRKDHLDLCRHLDFFAYELYADVPVATEENKFALLEKEGFHTPKGRLVNSEADFRAAVARYEEELDAAPYLTDGLVLSVNDLARQRERGVTAHHPKGKMAFKFKSDTAVTAVRDILLDVGRTGRITFVGVVDPVELSGATVSRVTLNNAKYIADNRINRGCTIEITRSGEVIPKHERTIAPAGEFPFPDHCPACANPLVRSDSSVDLVCANTGCPARTKARIANWIAVTGIENLGDNTLEKFFEKGLVRRIEDLYLLSVDDMAKVDGLGDKSARRILDSMSRTLPFDIFLAALGIDGLGPSIAKLVTAAFPDPDALRAATAMQLTAIPGIGDTLAASITAGLSQDGWDILAQLREAGVNILATAQTTGPLTGKTFVITGKLSAPREEIAARIERRGGKVTGAVSANTSFLVCNEASNSGKFKKAQQLGVPVITEAQLEEMLA